MNDCFYKMGHCSDVHVAENSGTAWGIAEDFQIRIQHTPSHQFREQASENGLKFTAQSAGKDTSTQFFHFFSMLT